MAVLAFGAAAQCGAGEFTARFAGQQLRVHPARVSAFPMNQVWDMKGQSLLIQVRQAKLGRTNSGRSYIVKKSTYD